MNSRRSGVLAAMAVAAAGIGAAAWPGATTAQSTTTEVTAPDRTVRVSPGAGVAGDMFTASGTGCEGSAFITYTIDGDRGDPFPTNDSPWDHEIRFPVGEGNHVLIFKCHDLTTAGAPTTFFAPGAVRFTYDPVTVRTLSSPESTPSQPATPSPAEPAEPAPGSANYTG
jgi:hypothetical protein